MYDTLSLAELQALRVRFLGALSHPRLTNATNCANVATWLGQAEDRLRTLAVDGIRERDTTPSIHDMRTGARQPRNGHDTERLAWSYQG